MPSSVPVTVDKASGRSDQHRMMSSRHKEILYTTLDLCISGPLVLSRDRLDLCVRNGLKHVLTYKGASVHLSGSHTLHKAKLLWSSTQSGCAVEVDTHMEDERECLQISFFG